MTFNFGFAETVLWTNVGGLAGIYFFAFLSRKLIAWWKKMFRKSKWYIQKDQRVKKVFTRKNRRIVRIKQKYGLFGIALITPLLLSIPVGVFLVVRYYKSSSTKFIYLITANIFWSIIYTGFYMFWEGLFFDRI
jgi:hypothetical protein